VLASPLLIIEYYILNIYELPSVIIKKGHVVCVYVLFLMHPLFGGTTTAAHDVRIPAYTRAETRGGPRPELRRRVANTTPSKSHGLSSAAGRRGGS